MRRIRWVSAQVSRGLIWSSLILGSFLHVIVTFGGNFGIGILKN